MGSKRVRNVRDIQLADMHTRIIISLSTYLHHVTDLDCRISLMLSIIYGCNVFFRSSK